MAENVHSHIWGNVAAYEAYVGRWSRPVARKFVAWLAIPAGWRWLDVGCGTGALTEAILTAAAPREVLGIDPSPDFIGAAQDQVTDPHVHFALGDARNLSMPDDTSDAVVAGLVLNHVSEPEAALAEMVRVARSGGTVAAYVWDYAGQMELVRTFWQAAIALDPAAVTHDQGVQYPLCQPAPLAAFFAGQDVQDVIVEGIVVPTVFRDFADYWQPHVMGGSGIAQRYVSSLADEHRAALRDRLHATLPVAADGTIPLMARAWAVRGSAP